MATSPAPAPPRFRLSRWLAGLVVLLVLLAAYALALRWVTEQIGHDVENTFREAPVLDDHTPRIN
jgi:hypothetical protein